MTLLLIFITAMWGIATLAFIIWAYKDYKKRMKELQARFDQAMDDIKRTIDSWSI